MIIKVPATSANIGPGFDSIGLAVSKYLEIEILEEQDTWFVEHDLGDVPHNQDNLLLQTALRLAPDIKPHHIKMTSDIPLARGLGSSSSVIVAGIELANQLANLDLSNQRKLTIANQIEGHPDNVAPAIFGQLVIASQLDTGLDYVRVPFPDSALVAFIPDYELKTSDSRQVLPQHLSYKQAVKASSVANLAISALLNSDLVKAGRAIENDMFHEIYRQKLVKEFQEIKQVAKSLGAYATYLSGAGPTVMIICPKDTENNIVTDLKKLELDGQVIPLSVDQDGLQVIQ